MIDTLVREGLQSDTNIYLVHFLKELGEAVVWMSRFSGTFFILIPFHSFFFFFFFFF